MIIYGVYIVSKSGGLIFNLDNNVPRIEHEKTFTYPLDLMLDYNPKKVSVVFNRKDGINGKEFKLIYFSISFLNKLVTKTCSWSRFGGCKWGSSKWRHHGRWS